MSCGCRSHEIVRNYQEPGNQYTPPRPTPITDYDKAPRNDGCTCKHHPASGVGPGPYGTQSIRGGVNPQMENYRSSLRTPPGTGINSYQSHGNTHSSGPSSTPSTRFPIQIPMGANPN